MRPAHFGRGLITARELPLSCKPMLHFTRQQRQRQRAVTQHLVIQVRLVLHEVAIQAKLVAQGFRIQSPAFDIGLETVEALKAW